MPDCPICGLPVIEFGVRQEPPFCSPIQSPECWRVAQVYDRNLRRWVLTTEPGEGEEPPTVAAMNAARAAGPNATEEEGE